MNLEKATPIALSSIEQEDKHLLKVKSSRNDKEYIWTSKASAMLYLLRNYKVDHILWLDGDTYFYSNPEPIFEEWGSYSVMLTKEKWKVTSSNGNQSKGLYNTGFMGFKNDKQALQCLKWFRKELINWCYDEVENGLWSDQFYVNNWRKKFQNVGVIKNIGVNLTPSKIQRSKVEKINNEIYVNNKRLIFYHSFGFRYYDGNEFDLYSYIYTLNLSNDVLKWIYLPYIYEAKEIVKQINSIENNFYKEDRPKDKFIRNYFNVKLNEENNRDCYQLCTIMTKDYLVQGIALYNSLKRHTSKFHLWICCVDKTVYELLNKMNLENVTLISLENIKDEKLNNIKKQRKIHEFCWTLKAPFISYLMKHNYNLNSILYIDADVFFFEDIKMIYEDWGNESIYLTPLMLRPKHEKRKGKYSAGLIGFKRDEYAMKCLRWWKRKCISWCYDRFEKDKWSDQKYLDHWPNITSKIKISENLGINAGPWYIRRGYQVFAKDNRIFFNGYQLICYHFSGLRIFNKKEYELSNRTKLPERLQLIYAIYVDELAHIITEIKKIDENFISTISSTPNYDKLYNYFTLNQSTQWLKNLMDGM
ncbi:glycosyltransferase [Natronincola ferrireducens]|nr:glycosyltransferase [Natronincola ferrireducens]